MASVTLVVLVSDIVAPSILTEMGLSLLTVTKVLVGQTIAAKAAACDCRLGLVAITTVRVCSLFAVAAVGVCGLGMGAITTI